MGEPDPELDALARAVVGAGVEVHRILGPGFGESAYEEALAVELGLRRIPFARQVPVELVYKGVAIGSVRVDLVVGGRLVVELKACDAIAPVHLAQVRSYLKATGLSLGLLINFNMPLLLHGTRRVILSR
jgi:GxxExxY protein